MIDPNLVQQITVDDIRRVEGLANRSVIALKVARDVLTGDNCGTWAGLGLEFLAGLGVDVLFFWNGHFKNERQEHLTTPGDLG